ncbi:MAG: hypothetical protein UW64_C0024G0013 [Microgenomates group bacterium GW2011_GWC1_44_37]|nr:MAG: hypothetical protein UW64_C0024G0013 [Microgenomates group bacterium GW2011_GWC1_44_37]
MSGLCRYRQGDTKGKTIKRGELKTGSVRSWLHYGEETDKSKKNKTISKMMNVGSLDND